MGLWLEGPGSWERERESTLADGNGLGGSRMPSPSERRESLPLGLDTGTGLLPRLDGGEMSRPRVEEAGRRGPALFWK